MNTSFFRFQPDHRDLALHYLVETENDLNKVNKLLEGGENPNLESPLGNTPLHLAVLNVAENGPIVDALIKAGANVNVRNCYKNTPLDFAVIYRKHTVIEILLQTGADVNLEDKIGNSPLHYAIKNCMLFKNMNSTYLCTESNKRVDFWIIEKLLQKGAKINVRNIFGQSPLYLAVEVGNLQLVQMLLSNGASTNVHDYRYGHTPLHIVLQKRTINISIVFELLSHGAKADFKNINSITPWMLAIQKYFASWWDHENAKVLMKYFVLFTSEYRTFRISHSTPRTEKLIRFYHKCTFEAEVLKSDVITLNYTVYDFIANNSDEKYLKSGYSERKISDYVFRNLKKGIYDVYVDEILKRIGRSYLTEKIMKTRVSAKGQRNQVKVYLKNVDLQEISLYLSLFDMFNLIVAKSKYNWFNTGRGLLQRNILRVLHTYAPNFLNTSFVLRLL